MAHFLRPRRALIKLVVLLIFVAGGFVMSCLPARGDTTPNPTDIDIEVRPGFGGLLVNRFGGWVPFRILITNQGPPVSGKLVVFADAPPNHQSRRFSQDVQLPTGSRKLYEIEAYLNSMAIDPVVQLIERSSSGERIVAQTSINIEQESVSGAELVEVAVVDAEESALNTVNSLPLESNRVAFTAQPLGSGTTSGVQPGAGPGPRYGFYGRPLKGKPVVIGPTELPRGFAGYDPVDAVVLNAAPLSQLDGDQAKALRLWVAEGGLLIVTGAADFSGLRPSGLDVLLPVDVLGSQTVASAPELTNLYGLFESPDSILITAARLRPGAKLQVGTPDRPLIAERRYGKGRVTFVAIDPGHNPFRSWKGLASLWQDLLVPAAQFRQGRFSPANFNGQLSNTLFDMAEVKPPSAGHLLLFLIAYLLVVGPLNYFGLRLMRKLDLAWITIPVVVVVFTGFSIVAAQTSRGSDLVASSVSTIEVYQRDGVSRISSDLLLVFPSKNLHEVGFDSGAFINDASLVAGGDPITTTYRAGKTLLEVPTGKWTPLTFRARGMTEGQRPSVSLEGVNPAVPGGSVTVKNLTSSSITRAVVITSAGVTGLFDLGPGEARECELRSPASQTFFTWYAGELSGTPDGKVLQHLSPGFAYGGAMLNVTADPLTSVPMPDLIKKLEGPLLIGLGEKTEPEIAYNGPVKRVGRQLFIIHL